MSLYCCHKIFARSLDVTSFMDGHMFVIATLSNKLIKVISVNKNCENSSVSCIIL